MAPPLPKALFLTQECPFPPTSGAKMRDSRMIQFLVERMEVELLCFARDKQERDAFFGALATPPRELKLTLLPSSRSIFHRTLPNMEQALRARAAKGKLLWVSREEMSPYIPLARELGYRVILDSDRECKGCKESDLIVTTSDADATRMLRQVPRAPVQVIPNSIDFKAYESARSGQGKTLFFSGSLSLPANVEGLAWFIEEVLPRLRAARGPSLPRIVAAGSEPTQDLRKNLEKVGVEVLSNPPSILPALSEAAIAFVPMRSGEGTRLKILEAMAAGRAVVTTSKGAEGLLLSPGYDIWISDSADGFTSGILLLLESPALRSELGARACETVRTRYDWSHVGGLFDRLLREFART